jgi:hypothetical protein
MSAVQMAVAGADCAPWRPANALNLNHELRQSSHDH